MCGTTLVSFWRSYYEISYVVFRSKGSNYFGKSHSKVRTVSLTMSFADASGLWKSSKKYIKDMVPARYHHVIILHIVRTHIFAYRTLVA